MQHDVATTRMEAWHENMFEPFGPASFLPAQRIQSQFGAAFNRMTDEVLYVSYTTEFIYMNVIVELYPKQLRTLPINTLPCATLTVDAISHTLPDTPVMYTPLH